MRVCLVAVLLIAAGLAHGQTVYRCGNSYSQTPCATEAKAVQLGPSAAPERPADMPTGKALCIAFATQFLTLSAADAARVTAVKGPATVIQYAGQPMAVHQFNVRAEGRSYLCFLSGDENRVLKFGTPLQLASESAGTPSGGLGSLSSPTTTIAPSTRAAATVPLLPPTCHIGPRGGTYTITSSGRKNYAGC